MLNPVVINVLSGFHLFIKLFAMKLLRGNIVYHVFILAVTSLVLYCWNLGGERCITMLFVLYKESIVHKSSCESLVSDLVVWYQNNVCYVFGTISSDLCSVILLPLLSPLLGELKMCKICHTYKM